MSDSTSTTRFEWERDFWKVIDEIHDEQNPVLAFKKYPETSPYHWFAKAKLCEIKARRMLREQNETSI